MKVNKNQAMLNQGYEDNPIAAVCANCLQYESDVYTVEAFGNKRIEKNKRCGLGLFPVRKTGTCKRFIMAVI